MEFIPAKTILQKAGSSHMSWFGADYNMNLYKGCCHGCIYCDSRSDCYRIDDFDTVRIKDNCILMLEQELKHKRKTGVVGIGAMSDTYNPFEAKYKITRQALQLVADYGYGAALDTKSNLVTRDVDVLKTISQKSSCIVKITITTTDDVLSKKIEPNVCVSSKRFEAINYLTNQGIFAGILFTPMLPFITDTEENVREMVLLAHKNGARFIYPSFGVTLRENQRVYYYERLDELFPGLKERYMNTFGSNYSCISLNSGHLYNIFKRECKRYDILYKMADIIAVYKKTNEYEQITFSF